MKANTVYFWAGFGGGSSPYGQNVTLSTDSTLGTFIIECILTGGGGGATGFG